MALLIVVGSAAAILLSALTALTITVRAMAAPMRGTVGEPPEGIGARSVSLTSAAGHALAGWFAPGLPCHGAVLLLHGIRADRRMLAHRMAVLARAGIATLAIDLRAHGESGGAAVTFGHLEAHDVAGALAWLRGAAPGEKLGGLGISLGGAALLLASASVSVDAMVLESVFPDLRSAVSNRVRCVVGSAGRVVSPALLAVGEALTGARADDLRPIEALRTYAGPVLILSGGADRHTTPEESRAMLAAAAGPKDLWILEGAGHVDMALAAGPVYDDRMLAFFGRHLQQNTSCA